MQITDDRFQGTESDDSFRLRYGARMTVTATDTVTDTDTDTKYHPQRKICGSKTGYRSR